MTRLKHLLFTLTAIVLCLVLITLVAEVVLRLTRSTPYHRNALNAFHVPDPTLGWKGLPGFSGVFVRDDFKARITFNENGYRRKDSTVKPAQGARKIVFLGDSFAWGWGVSQGELFSDHLQDILGPGWDVINMGVNTFGTVQEQLQLEKEALPLGPESVYLLFYGNDFKDNMDPRSDNRPYCEVRNGSVVLKNLPIRNPIGSGFRSFSRMSYALTHFRYYFNYLKEYVKIGERYFEKLFLKTKTRAEPRPVEAGTEEQEVDPEAAAVFDRYLGKMADSCRASGVGFTVVYVPVGENIAMGRPETRYADIVRDACGRRKIPMLDLTPVFKPLVKGGNGEPLYFRDDLHWTAQGHRLAAETIHGYIESVAKDKSYSTQRTQRTQRKDG